MQGNGARPQSPDLTPEERRLRHALQGLGLLSLAFAAGYLAMGVLGDSRFPFVANSLAKDFLLAALCAVGAADVRRHTFAVVLVIAAHVALIVGMLAVLVAGDASSVTGTLAGPHPSPGVLLAVWLGGDVLVVVLFTVLYERAQRARFGLRYLGNAEFRALMALAETLVVRHADDPQPLEVAHNADRYLASFGAHDKWKIRLALAALAYYPLLTLRPPFAMMDPQLRKRFVERRFLDDVAARRMPGPLRTVVQSLIRAAQQMVYLGYYGDERAAERCGYVPFSRREGYAQAIARVEPDRPRVRCMAPREVDAEVITADVVVVGSGAGGGTAAVRMAERGREVLVLERGRHVDPSQFTENEAEQFSALYADGALTLTRDFRFQVLQGMCVGGGTVVNNAVCFDLPEPVLDRWNDPDGLDAGLDEARLRDAFVRVRGLMGVGTMPANGTLQPGGRKFAEGVQRLRLDAPPYDYGIVTANIADCLGSGYCNIGCAYGKKLSMLDRVLPAAQERFGPDGLRVLAECRVERMVRSGARATELRCTLGDGRSLRVRARTVILAAGALASSIILRRSGLGGRRVGTGLGFNIASPLTADFDEELHAERGLQISHYLKAPHDEGFALETWFNPIVSQSLLMPGWLDVHYENMRRYAHMTCVGAVVGSRANATVRPARFGRGVDLRYTPHPDDFAALLKGMQLAGRVMFAAGARRVMPSSFRFLEFGSEDELDELPRLLADDSDLSVNSAHPQGGNAVSADESKGVLDPDFRVRGVENLYVCDASAFPSAITVNPQLTVMALADYASANVE